MNSSNTRLRKNLDALERAHPGLAHIVGTAEPPEALSIEMQPTGVLKMAVGGTLVHSARNPEREARRMVQDLAGNPAVRVVVCFGFGLGYVVEQVLAVETSLHCVVFDANPGAVREALKHRALEHVLDSDRLSLFTACPPEHVAPVIATLRREHVYAIRLRALYGHDEQVYKRLDEVLDTTFRRKDINRATLKRFGRRWVRNLAANLETIATARPVARLKDAYSGIPAIVLAGGPSLDLILPHLAELRKRSVLIAVDTSLVAVLRAGITPDYTVIVDPQYWNTRHLDACLGTETHLVSESSTHPRVFRLLGSSVTMCSSLFPLGTYLETAVGELGKLGAGGSVSTTAWDFARHIGCTEIYCAGLDLGFPLRNTHFRGSFFEERALTFCSRTFPVETMAFDYLQNASPLYCTDYTGKPVLSDARMRIYHWWFENQAALNPAIRTFNLSDAAVAIPGIEHAPPRKLLEHEVARDEIDRRRAALHPEDSKVSPASADTAGPSDATGGRRRLGARIAELCRQLDELATLCSRALTVLPDPKRAGARPAQDDILTHDDIAALNEIDRQIQAIDARDVAGFLVQNVVEDAIYTPSGDPTENSRLLYSRLLESSLEHAQILGTASAALD